jgi:hypothetical protein
MEDKFDLGKNKILARKKENIINSELLMTPLIHEFIIDNMNSKFLIANKKYFIKSYIKIILEDNSDAKIITTSDAASFIEDSIIAKAGESYEIGGFKLDFFGKDHAAIIPGQIPCENIGVVVNGSIMNPGDSFDYSNIGAKVLFVPISAPWLKIAESMDFVDKVKPRIVIPVHDALLSDLGKSINDNWMKKACDKAGAEYRDLSFGENVVY